jgi:regulator of sigma E protease
MARILVILTLIAAVVIVPGLVFGQNASVSVGRIIFVILGVGFIIFVHELGHYLTARLVGARVYRFYLGFAPVFKIFGLKISLKIISFKKGGTEYGIGALIFGGFCEIAGQDPTQTKGKPYELMSKTPSQRALVFAAGAIMNAIFGFLLFMLAFTIGVSFVTPEVGRTLPDKPAWKAGIRSGDRIRSVNGKPVTEFNEFAITISLMRPGSKAEVVVDRDGKELAFTLKPELSPRGTGLWVGVGSIDAPVIKSVEKKSPADEAGIEPGDRIKRVLYKNPETGADEDFVINTFDDFRDAVSLPYLVGKEIEVEIERAGEKKMLKIVPTRHKAYIEMPRLGIEPVGYPLAGKSLRVKSVRGGPSQGNRFKEGDEIVSINNRKFIYFPYLPIEFPGAEEIVFTVLRKTGDGGEKEITFSIPARAAHKWIGKAEEVLLEDAEGLVVTRVIKGSPASKPLNERGDRLEAGDVILSVGGDELSEWGNYSLAMMKHENKTVAIAWKRGDEKFEGNITPATGMGDPAYIGVSPKSKRFMLREGPLAACALGWERTVLWGKRVFLILRSLTVDRTVSGKNLAGPIGIAHVSYKVLDFGVGYLIYLLALISINLCIVNLLPIPILDGGHLLFLLIEKIKGSPVGIKVQTAAFTAGMVLILAMLFYVTFNDIMRLFTGF